MIYLKEFSNHKDYSDIMNNVEIQIEVPSVSYVKPSGATIVTGQTI